MKKALHQVQKAFLSIKDGKIRPEETNMQEILDAINHPACNGREHQEKVQQNKVQQVFEELRDLINRFLQEGITEDFLNELNANLGKVKYTHQVMPSDFYSCDDKLPQSIFVVDLNYNYSPSVVAAKEFSKFITTQMLYNLKKCELNDCKNFYLGRPDSKWCSKTCGSKSRVRKKRRNDLLR
jgi:hypothetical protein